MQKFLFVLVISIGVPAWAEETSPPLQDIHMPSIEPDDPPAVMLYTKSGMEPMPPPPPPGQPYTKPIYEHKRVHVAAWMDGRIVWSHDLERGGSPYFTGKIAPAKVQQVYRVLAEETSGTDQKRTSYTIPDGSFQTILMLSKDRKTGIKWESVLPIVDRSEGKTTYTINGLVGAANYQPPAQPSEKENNLQNFFKDFNHLRGAILALPPAKDLKFN